jgi:hypothetical protein
MTQLNVGGAAAVSKKELLRGSAIAALVAGILLVGAVLPAEYGIDPTGIGKGLGLTALNNAATAAATPATAAPAAPGTAAGPALPTTVPPGSTVSAKGEQRGIAIASKQALPYRSDTMEIVLAPQKGVEVKTHLAKGATLIYSWKTQGGEPVNHDFHGEPVDAGKDEFESFILEKGVSESRGALIAPFTGVHGWYWKNKTNLPITVVLTASGFYRDIYKK